MNWKLLNEYGFTRYLPSQWFSFQFNGRPLQFCQTDGLLFTPKQQKVLIVEVKYKHTPDAYWQLEDKYLPIIRWLFRDWEISTVEIVKWYDASTQFPTQVMLRKNILNITPREFGVHIMSA